MPSRCRTLVNFKINQLYRSSSVKQTNMLMGDIDGQIIGHPAQHPHLQKSIPRFMNILLHTNLQWNRTFPGKQMFSECWNAKTMIYACMLIWVSRGCHLENISYTNATITDWIYQNTRSSRKAETYHNCRRTVRSSRYMVFDRKSIPIVACSTKNTCKP